MTISVIIPSYNTQDSIELTLQSLANQNTKQSFEVIVVDCSEHDLVLKLCEKYTDVKFISKTERFNPGEGRNIGAQTAQGELLIFIDADVVLNEKALDNAWQHYTKGCKAFGGALELKLGNEHKFASYLEHYFFNHESQFTRNARERKNLSSAFMCIDKHLFVDAGGFKDIPRMQDTELTERLSREGTTLMFFPDLIAYQAQGSSLKHVLKKIFINGQNLFFIRYNDSSSFFDKIGYSVFLPFLAFLKLSRIIARHIKYQPKAKKLHVLTYSIPLYMCGLYWMLGFYDSLIFNRGINAER